MAAMKLANPAEPQVDSLHRAIAPDFDQFIL